MRFSSLTDGFVCPVDSTVAQVYQHTHDAVLTHARRTEGCMYGVCYAYREGRNTVSIATAVNAWDGLHRYPRERGADYAVSALLRLR